MINNDKYKKLQTPLFQKKKYFQKHLKSDEEGIKISIIF